MSYMMKMAHDDWFDQNEEDLKYAYCEMLNNSKSFELYDEVFWFTTPKDKLDHAALNAKLRWENWLDARYREYCERGPEPEEHDHER